MADNIFKSYFRKDRNTYQAFKLTPLKCRSYTVKLEIPENISKVEWRNMAHPLWGNPHLTHVSKDSHEKQGEE